MEIGTGNNQEALPINVALVLTGQTYRSTVNK